MAKETPDLSGLIGNLLANPGALSALTGIIGNLGGTNGDKQAPPPKEDEGKADGDEAPPPAPVMLPFTARSNYHQNREGLLGALRPYLSPKRRQALEGACKLLEVIELFRTQRRGDI